MFYLSAQPDNLYFYWQLEVQINNFRKHKIENKMIILIGYDQSKGVSSEMNLLSKRTKARIVFYPDKREDKYKVYIPSIRLYLLKQFFSENPEIFYNKAWMYHDCDILFREVPKFKNINKDKFIYLSDTKNYLDSKYVRSKSDDLFREMCGIVKVDSNLIIENDSSAGGAQYVFGGNAIVGSFFWDKVLEDSVLLYDHMIKTSSVYSPNHPIQAWTSDMWAILWNLWLMGYNTKISEDLKFSWPTYSIKDWDNYKIFHNAGVISSNKDLFFKGNFIDKTPFNESLESISKEYCSYKYVQEIEETKIAINSIC